MSRLTKAAIKAINFLISIMLFPTAIWLSEIGAQAPRCCGRKTNFTGSHTSLFGEELFYQCVKCKTEFTIPNKHEGISVMRLWRTIFLGGTK
jgi:hypothetical protein